MFYPECKIYYDGSHYIAIPRTVQPLSKRHDSVSDENAFGELTQKEVFEQLYSKHKELSRSELEEAIVSDIKQYFDEDKDIATVYVKEQLARKRRNMICRRVRLHRKVNLQEFNYFCTFTYDGKKHTEESFKDRLRGCFKNFCHRKGWKYVGVWERSPEKQRLHFHGLFYIPDGTMPGELIEVKDYSPIKGRMQVTIQSTYFNERFGRSDFKLVEDRSMLGEAMAYLTKYMEKTGEKLVYSKGLPQYFVSDVADEDVVCRVGKEDRKMLLFDNFCCWDEGEFIGNVSNTVIDKMRKSN